MGAMKVHGGGQAAAAQAAGGGKSKAGGKGAFSTPPGLAGRGWSELPPGIQKKVAKPQAAPATTTGAKQASEGAATKQATGSTATTPTTSIAPKVGTERPDVKIDTAGGGGELTDAELAAREAQYEKYLADLSAGRTTKDHEPEGFRDWARQQLLLETGRDETMQTEESALADAITDTGPPAPPTTGGGPTASTEPYNIARSPY